MNDEITIWHRQKSEQIADCKVFKVRQDFSKSSANGNEHPFFVIECADWVNIIPLTETGKIVLIEQFRHGIEEITLEIPGGMVDEGESPENSARRELLEETGFSPKKVVLLGKSRPNPAIQDNWVYHFLAIDCEKTAEPEFDATESVSTKLISLPEIDDFVSKGQITHTLVIAAFHYLKLYRDQKK